MWCDSLERTDREGLAKGIALLRETPSSILSSSSYVRELRILHDGCTYRLLYGFDPGLSTYLLLAGGTTATSGWYEMNVPKAEVLYAAYLKKRERVRKCNSGERTAPM